MSQTLVALVTLIATTAAGVPPPAQDPVTQWVEKRAHAIETDRDFAPLSRSVRAARIVGLGEAAHQLSEITTLKHRTLRYLVERHGFRSIAWEEDWSLGTQINDYVLGRRDDRDALVGQMSATAWRTREVAGVLGWLRRYNDTHSDKVRFFGVEYFATRPFAYDRLEAYIAAAAPGRLAEARGHLRPLKPFTKDMHAYGEWFRDNVDDPQTYVTHAERLHNLVATIPHKPGDQRYALAAHATRQIRSYYTAFTLADNFAFRDARAAENLRWWERFSGDKVVYWAASAHTADVPELTITLPPYPDTRFASAGSYLRDWYGPRYVSIGFTFDHGAGLPAPAPAWFEHPLGAVHADQFLYEVDDHAPQAVRAWLTAPMLTRGYPEAGHTSTMSGGTPSGWFDAIVHRQQVTPATPLGPVRQ